MSSAVMPRPPRTVRRNSTAGSAACSARTMCQGNAPPAQHCAVPCGHRTDRRRRTDREDVDRPARGNRSGELRQRDIGGDQILRCAARIAQFAGPRHRSEREQDAEQDRGTRTAHVDLSGISPGDSGQGNRLPMRRRTSLAAIPGGESRRQQPSPPRRTSLPRSASPYPRAPRGQGAQENQGRCRSRTPAASSARAAPAAPQHVSAARRRRRGTERAASQASDRMESRRNGCSPVLSSVITKRITGAGIDARMRGWMSITQITISPADNTNTASRSIGQCSRGMRGGA